MSAEAYIKSGRVVIVHERRDGYVYFHAQGINDDWIPYESLGKISEDLFRAAVANAEPVDVARLPALDAEE